ncbi:hypothetical protein ACFW9D_33930 [Streptomyces sp. NPDC059524]|uniref:hypothetical protein n=1 Tax=Streptomyces sp. NPDC059524 TaxID=3346856 RepID=UPI0036CA040A
MRIVLDDDWTATVTGDPLRIAPRFDFRDFRVRVVPYADLTSLYRDPDPEPPATATRRLLSDCLDLLTEPVADDLVDGEPGAVARLRAVDEELRGWREDSRRAAALRELIARYVEDHGDG